MYQSTRLQDVTGTQYGLLALYTCTYIFSLKKFYIKFAAIYRWCKII